ncbi:acyl-CoA dehydrogenase family protein [Massilia sp. W12]|uniref:acyl-CoA dehydrogenase family protein n=1 Tax=Massilia sp. W12 TaxID=3126507 RepID=UPI0030CD6CD6
MSAEHALVTRARAFAQEVLRPQAGQFDREQGVPRAVLQQMAQEGFLGAPLPQEYGGAGLDALNWGWLSHEIGKGCSSARALLTVHSSLVGETLARLGNAAQKEKYLPRMARGELLACFALTEPEVGSDAASAKTSYQLQADGSYQISGHKKWITYGALADLMLVFANGEQGGCAFLVERGAAGLETRPMRDLLASRGAHLAYIDFANTPVAASAMLGKPGAGFSFVANTALFYGRCSIAWAGVSLLEAALEEMATYARNREQGGKKLRQHQMIQHMIADAVSAAHSARALCERVARMRMENNDDAVTEANIAKYHSSTLAMKVCTEAVQLFGGNGIAPEYPVERLFREAKVLEIIEGSSQIQQQMISDYAVRRYRLPGKGRSAQ